jgi:hypothetical protein
MHPRTGGQRTQQVYAPTVPEGPSRQAGQHVPDQIPEWTAVGRRSGHGHPVLWSMPSMKPTFEVPTTTTRISVRLVHGDETRDFPVELTANANPGRTSLTANVQPG